MLDTKLIQKTLRVPAPAGEPGDGAAAARQFDAALMSVGFKASGQLLQHLSTLHPGTVIDTAVCALGAVKHLVGDHIEHNVYFRDFPRNVPNTVEFWLERLAAALVDDASHDRPTLLAGGINLLALPGYGTYQHTYAEMLAAHEEFLPTVSDRVTVLHLGGDLDTEARAAYVDLAGSRTPLSEDDLRLLELLAAWCLDGEQPAVIPIRENRALINRVRLANDRPLLIDTVTDVLRLACALSGGDVTLATPTKFRSFARRDRRALMTALDNVVTANPDKLADVAPYGEPWKRLGERLHPHEHPQQTWPSASSVFAVARGEITVRSLVSRVEHAFDLADVAQAVRLLSNAPGLLVRNLDRSLRAAGPDEVELLRKTAGEVSGRVSGRVLLSLREHLVNRTRQDAARVFVNRAGRAWVTPDARRELPAELVAEFTQLVDDELARRLPACRHLVVDPAVLDVAVPLSGKATGAGFRIMPRGSRTQIDGDHLRFFIHWKQRQARTDYDLSALLLDDDFTHVGWLAYTNLSGYGGAHSGDITDATNGASEFIDLDLSKVPARYIVPQVNVYSGEGFDEAEESFFGFMTMLDGQRGKPFEPRTVRMRSEVRGTSRVALPLVFARDEDGGWSATWLHMFLRGASWGNQVESNRLSTALLARSIVERRFTPVGHLVGLLRTKAGVFSEYRDGMVFDGPVTFVGLDRPEGLPSGSEVYTLDRLNALVPA
jgi:hypothetical protein